MDDSHGKEISLQYVTVKVPGQKPRGSRGTQPQQTVQNAALVQPAPGLLVPGANGTIADPLGFPANKDKRTDKVMLTAYEVLKEPVTRMLLGNPADDPAALQNMNALNGDMGAKLETPSVKKRHRRMKSSSNKANDLEGML